VQCVAQQSLNLKCFKIMSKFSNRQCVILQQLVDDRKIQVDEQAKNNPRCPTVSMLTWHMRPDAAERHLAGLKLERFLQQYIIRYAVICRQSHLDELQPVYNRRFPVCAVS